MPSRSTLGFIVFVAFIVSPQAWGQQPKPLDDLTAYFVYHKLTDKPVDFTDLASRTLKARQANQFTRPRVVAAEEAALRKRYEDADPQAAYVVALQTKLTYELNEGRFAVEAFEPGRVLVLDPFGARMPHPMPPAEGRQHAVRLSFLNSANARHVPLEPAKARQIDPVVRQGATGAALEVILRFEASQPEPGLLQAQAESVRFQYVPVQGFVRMSNPRMWPLTQTYPIASVAPPDPATVVRPLDDLTAFFLYHKLSGEPVDFETIAQASAAVQRAGAFDKEQAAAAEAAALREKFDAIDPAATYAISVRTNLRYDMNGQRFETDAFQPGQILGFRPFAAAGGVPKAHIISDNRVASRYNRRLEFANAENARYVPIEPGQARAIGAFAPAIVEIHFTAADTRDSATEENKTLRAQISSVRYSASIGRPANWPLKDPIAVAPADLAPAASVAGTDAGADSGAGVATNNDERSRLDEWVVYFLYNKLTGRDSNLDAIAATSDVVRRAPQFEKAAVLAAEVARLQQIGDGVDPAASFWIRVSGRLHYELDQERFRVDLFDPGKFLNFNLPVQTGTALFNATQRRIAFANAEALRFIPMSREKAGAVDEIRRSGSAPFSAEVELQAIGGGDPTGAVQSDGTLRMAVRSIRYEANNSRPGDLWPFDEATVPPPYDRTMDPPVIAHNRFDIMELKTGIPLDDLRKTVTAKFGPVVDISPSRNEDPRLKTGFGFAPDSCFAFGNKVPEIGAICVRALADERRVVRKIVVEQILEGADWDPIRLALLEKYGAMAEAARKSQTQYYAWGPEVAESTANDDRLSPHRALTASLSPVQSMMDRMAASTRVLTNLKIRMIDPDWAGSPQPPAPPAPAAQSAGRTPRL